MSTKTASTVNAGHKAWATRRANIEAARAASSVVRTPEPSKMSLAGKKAWETRRANGAVAVKATIKTTDNVVNLSGLRRIRASVPTLVSKLNMAKSVEYYYSSTRSVIVVNS